jgi:hypothetical protein
MMSLEELLTETKNQAGSEDPMELLAAGRLQQQRLAKLSDLLMDRLVEQARTSGRSWNQIGEVLGVSKQAVHEKHRSVGFNPYTKYTDDARTIVVKAQELSRQLGHKTIGSGHLLLAVLDIYDNLINRVLVELGIETVALRHEIESALVDETPSSTDGGMHPDAKAALDQAARQAVDMGDDHIGVEHLLLGLLAESRGPASSILSGHGLTTTQLRAQIVAAR